MANEKVLACSRTLAQKRLTISFAESATAGWLCSEFALAPESGEVLKGAIVCYDAQLKEKILGVPKRSIDEYTPESAEVTREMVLRSMNLIPSDIHIAVTGLTTPGGSETAEKPVGTMFVAGMVKGRPFGFRKVFSGSCEEIIQQTISATAELIRSTLQRI